MTVVSDARANTHFPPDRLEPGRYKIAIRASGYALDGAGHSNSPAGQAARPTSSSSRPGAHPISSPTPNGWRAPRSREELKRSCSTAPTAMGCSAIFESKHSAPIS